MRPLLLALVLGCATPMPPPHVSPPEFGCRAVLNPKTCEWTWRCYERTFVFWPENAIGDRREFDADCLAEKR